MSSPKPIEPILLTTPSSRAQSTADIQAVVDRLERLTRLMDERFQLPFLNRPVGLDALIGLAPVVGDVVSAAIAGWIVLEAKRLGASKWLLARMTWNVFADVTGGAIPFAGDVFDVYFRANRRNVDLLKAWLRKNGHALLEPATRNTKG